MLWSVLYEVFWKVNPYSRISRILCKRKENYIGYYLNKNYKHILDKYSKVRTILGRKLSNNIPIYFFWYQGWNNTPIIKNNYNTLKRFCGKRVIFISSENVEEFIHLPKIIYEKLECGMISYTHFADIVRMTLIAERGGIWIDATTFVCKNISEKQENLAIITRKSQPLIKSGVFHKNRFTC